MKLSIIQKTKDYILGTKEQRELWEMYGTGFYNDVINPNKLMRPIDAIRNLYWNIHMNTAAYVCKHRGHKWEIDEYGNAETGYTNYECLRCGKSGRHIYY